MARPPHVLLLIGSYAVTFGAVVLVQALRSHSDKSRRRALLVPLLMLAGCTVVEVMVLHIEAVFLVYQHTAAMYRTLALFIPGILCAFSVASGHRWACAIATSIYTAALLAFTWVLPLVPAEPKLGPVYQHVTHLVPNGFPLLLIVPALAIDLIRAHMPALRRWLASLVIGVAFVALLFAVQWPFANFLQSPAARNWVFGSQYFAYMLAPTSFSARPLFV